MKLYACIKERPNYRVLESYSSMQCGWGNGYVLIPKEHQLFGIDYNDKRLRNLQVHGGITWANREVPGEELVEWIIETPENITNFWVFGFDTAHYNSHKSMDKEWVKQETLRLLEQLQSIK